MYMYFSFCQRFFLSHVGLIVSLVLESMGVKSLGLSSERACEVGETLTDRSAYHFVTILILWETPV